MTRLTATQRRYAEQRISLLMHELDKELIEHFWVESTAIHSWAGVVKAMEAGAIEILEAVPMTYLFRLLSTDDIWDVLKQLEQDEYLWLDHSYFRSGHHKKGFAEARAAKDRACTELLDKIMLGEDASILSELTSMNINQFFPEEPEQREEDDQ